MRRDARNRWLALAAVAMLLVAAPLSAQQGHGGPPPGGGGFPGGAEGGANQRPGGPFGSDRGPEMPGPPPQAIGAQGAYSTMRGGLQLGPPGRWWNDKAFASSLHLQHDQQARMDRILGENKNTLLARYDDLKQQERQLEGLTRGAQIDEQALFAGIDRVAGARAALEKANAHMLMQIRDQLTPDQLKALDAHRPAPQ